MTFNTDDAPLETIRGQIVAKANNYQAVPDGHGGRRIIKNKRIRAYEQTFAAQCVKYAGQHINRPFTLVVEIYYKSRNYDLDNSLKTLLDCLQYVGAIEDDNLCTWIAARKFVDKNNPRVSFLIYPEEDGQQLELDL